MMVQEIVSITFDPAERDRFKEGLLVQEWFSQYPFIFDELDRDQAAHQCQFGYHYFEWLAAIHFYKNSGYYSLVSQYCYKKHRRKQEILKKLVDIPTYEMIIDRKTYHAQPPDLLVPHQKSFVRQHDLSKI